MTIREFFKIYTENALALSNKNRFNDYILLVTVVFLLILLKPFGIEQLNLQIVGFWTVACITGLFIYAPLFYLGERLLLSLGWPYPFIQVLLAIVASCIMSFAITFVGSLVFHKTADYWGDFPVLFPQALIIGLILISVSMIMDYIKQQNMKLEQSAFEEKERHASIRFMLRLPANLRGELLCLEMCDHYIKVHTDKGSHMILMRMKDAVKELHGCQGLQVHRSWWVSESAIKGSKKVGRKNLLVIKSNVSIPVSRTYLPEVKARKLL